MDGEKFHSENREKIEWGSELNRIFELLKRYFDAELQNESLNDIEFTASAINGLIGEILSALEKQNIVYTYDGRLLEAGQKVWPLINGLHYLKSITAESLELAFKHGQTGGVVKQIEKTKNDVNLAINAWTDLVKNNHGAFGK